MNLQTITKATKSLRFMVKLNILGAHLRGEGHQQEMFGYRSVTFWSLFSSLPSVNCGFQDDFQVCGGRLSPGA